MNHRTGADLIAATLSARGVQRVFALCGGHIMPIWMALDAAGIEIVDVRDERAAVWMAHAHAAVGGGFGVALVTAGPGVTNAMTGIANAHVSRIPVLVLSGTPPRPQENRGALQDMSHTALVQSITRLARTVRHAHALPRELDGAIAAALGHGGEPGPAFLDFPVDVQREVLPEVLFGLEQIAGRPKPRARAFETDLDAAAAMIAAAERPVVISGRGANGAGAALERFLSVSGAGYLDTGESRGIVPESHPAHIGAMRGAAMTGADLVVTVGRKLDFQLAYGAPAVFGAARFLRISDIAQELTDNRLGDVALLGEVAASLDGVSDRLEGKVRQRDWVAGLRARHLQRAAGLADMLASAPSDKQGRIHPNRLLGEIRKRLDPDAVLIADGGDLLSFARVALSSATYLDPGPLGCIGLATPFAIGAAKAAPGRQVVAVTGDGAFGFSAIEIDTAARHRVPLMIVVSNNGAWAIEVRDQMERFGKAVGTELQFADHAAMARALGLKAWRIEGEDALAPVLDAAFAALAEGHTVLVDAVTSPEAGSSDSKTGLAWVPDLQALAAWDEAERVWLAT
ncbi:MAG TPA: thiamine pyrophosphate-binding protein [Pararhodobacter sp.]|uniref:thiamine pyrophosphate-binding protein n=1 Tax=Pararhodobacter sp. TaxID=2127056 RepID=UPI001DA9B81D|nr:thiamine pyrophosphate-binding protein [Pararhodobacter sp.]MCB1346572.1 thiamine pyrophosphate-binding protein [Paracoccaceae bacterium]HPD93922.1 thiamine pyrophosphate-binding protein [Pararhodobacter sp.]